MIFRSDAGAVAGARRTLVRWRPGVAPKRLRQFAASTVWWLLSVGIVVAILELAAVYELINAVILPPPHLFIAEIQHQAQFLLPEFALVAFWIGDGAAVFVGIFFSGTIVLVGRQMMNMNLTFLGMVMIGLTGYLLDAGFALLQKRVLWWKSEAQL